MCVGDLHKGWHARGYLPHFDAGAIVQTVTFRLAEQLAAGILRESRNSCDETRIDFSFWKRVSIRDEEIVC